METIFASAVVLVDAKGKLLLAQRPEHKLIMPGYWEFPGGKVEEGETPEACVIREAQEELGIRLHTIAPLTFISETREPEDAPPYHVVVYVFLCSEWEGEVQGAEGQHIAWIKPDSLREWDILPCNKPLIPLVEMVLSWLFSG